MKALALYLEFLLFLSVRTTWDVLIATGFPTRALWSILRQIRCVGTLPTRVDEIRTVGENCVPHAHDRPVKAPAVRT